MGPPPVVSEDFSQIEKWLLLKWISSMKAGCSAIKELLYVNQRKTGC